MYYSLRAYLILFSSRPRAVNRNHVRDASNAAYAPAPVPGLSTSASILTSARNPIKIVAIATTCFEPCTQAVPPRRASAFNPSPEHQPSFRPFLHCFGALIQHAIAEEAPREMGQIERSLADPGATIPGSSMSICIGVVLYQRNSPHFTANSASPLDHRRYGRGCCAPRPRHDRVAIRWGSVPSWCSQGT